MLKNKCVHFAAFVLLLLPSAAHSKWGVAAGTDSKVECDRSIFNDSAKLLTWKNGDDRFSVCSVDVFKPNDTLMLTQNFQILTALNGKHEQLAAELEEGAKPVEIKFLNESIVLTTFFREKAPALYNQEIACEKGKCLLSKKKCLIKPPNAVQDAISEIQGKLKAAPKSKRLAIWASYFMDEKNPKGRALVNQAMLGDEAANKLVSSDVGADAGELEVQNQLIADIKQAQKVCGATGHAR